MRNRIITSLFLVLFISCCEQHINNQPIINAPNKTDMNSGLKDTLLKDFTKKWKADSLGKNGFRVSNFDTVSWLINDINIVGYSKQELVNLLGKPNESGLGREDKLLMYIYVIQGSELGSDKRIIIDFNREDKIIGITYSTGFESYPKSGSD